MAPFLEDWSQREKPSLRLKISLVMSKLSIIKYIAWKISCEIFDLNPILLTLCHKFQYAIWCTNSIFGLFLCPGYPNPVDRILMGTFFMSKVDVVYELAVHSMLGRHDLPHSQD